MMLCGLVAATLATGAELAAIKVRRLGGTGRKVSVVGVGTWQLGGEWGRRYTQPEVDRLLGRARELGVNLVDTAECYGDHLAEALGVRRTRPSRCRAAACSSWPARLSSRLEAGTAGSRASRAINPSTTTWASRSTSGSTVRTGWSGSSLEEPVKEPTP